MSGDESDGHHDPDTEGHYHHLTHPPVNAFVDESSPLTRKTQICVRMNLPQVLHQPDQLDQAGEPGDV